MVGIGKKYIKIGEDNYKFLRYVSKEKKQLFLKHRISHTYHFKQLNRLIGMYVKINTRNGVTRTKGQTYLTKRM